MLIDRVRAGLCFLWASLLAKINAFASLLLGFALAYPHAVEDFVQYVPAPVRPFVPLLVCGWFALVQYAQHHDKKNLGNG